MKKYVTLVLALIMTLSLCACAGAGSTEEGGAGDGLQVGYARVNITPDYSVGLGGYSNQETRRSDGFIDYIYITCIAATEAEETVLIFTIDNCSCSNSVAELIRNRVTPATGIAAEKIFCAATHSHSCPSLNTGTDDTAGSKYMAMFLDAAVQAAQEALDDRSAATVLAATPVIENMNFVRHYEMADGTYAGSNFGDYNKGFVGHATESDPQMVLVKFDRSDDKKDVLMVNWQAHADHGNENGTTKISADFPGALREKLAADSGMLVAYFTGASGNQNPDSMIGSEKHDLSMKQYGEKLAEYAFAALDGLKPVEGSGIRTSRVMFEVEVDHSWDHLINEANQVYDLWKTQGKSAGDALGKTYDFTSSYQARAIRSRAAMDKTAQLELNVFSIGGIGFTTGTYEMFSDQGLYVKENSPFAVTFLLTGNNGYIPSAEAYDYRSYEADTGFYTKGTAEKLAEQYVTMLKGLQ